MRRLIPLSSKLFLVLLGLLSGPSLAAAENYAFLVAVQDYNVKDLKPLQFTRSDILAFAKILRESGFKDENIVLMTDKSEQRRYDAEAEKIRKQFDLLLSNVRDQDTLIVAFSGHGVQFEGDDKNNYYCPLDADLEDAKRTRLIALSEIYDKLKQCPAEKKLLLVDACRNDPLSQVKKARQTVHLKSVTRPQTEPVPKGIVALFSCAAGQESYEWPDLKHGVFFHHVLEGWSGAADDGDKNLTLAELMAYATQKTQAFARVKLDSAQTPQFKSDFQGTWVLRKLGSSHKPEIENVIRMKLRLIPAGTFVMGSPESEKGRIPHETQQSVTIKNEFYLGKYEVTQREWKAVMKTEPWKNDKNIQQGNDFPAADVDWRDAGDFCVALSRLDGRSYRLPTEVEWEWACRGRTKTAYYFGDSARQLGDFAWFMDNAFQPPEENQHARAVGLKKPNPFGLHDMHGNVWEWCRDLADDQTEDRRVIRGGGYLNIAAGLRSASRASSPQSSRLAGIGFRVVAEIPSTSR